MRCAEAARLPETGEQTGAVITSEMIRSYLETLSRRGRSRNTVQMYGAKLRAFYHYLPSDKRVEEAKCNPWCLRKLYLATRSEIERNVRLPAEQAYEQILDTEQLAAGWTENESNSIQKDVCDRYFLAERCKGGEEMKKRILSALMVLCLLLTLLPVSTLAAEEGTGESDPAINQDGSDLRKDPAEEGGKQEAVESGTADEPDGPSAPNEPGTSGDPEENEPTEVPGDPPQGPDPTAPTEPAGELDPIEPAEDPGTVVEEPVAENAVYVSAAGDDADGTGTADAPYATLAKAAEAAPDGATIYVMSDVEMNQMAWVWEKELTITSYGVDPVTLSRGENFHTNADPARQHYNPAMIEVGGETEQGTVSSLILTHIILDDMGKYEGEYFVQADSEGDGETTVSRSEVPNTSIVQDAIIATYNGMGTITLGDGAELRNYGGMSAVRLSGGELIMEEGSAILDTTENEREKGASGSFGPAGAVWLQGGILTMNGGTIGGDKGVMMNGRALYADGGTANIGGTIQNIHGTDAAWQGQNGVAVHLRSHGEATLASTGEITNVTGTNAGNNCAIWTQFCNFTTKAGSKISHVDGFQLLYFDDLDNNNYSHEVYLNGTISECASGSASLLRSWYGQITFGPNSVIENCSSSSAGGLIYSNNGSHYTFAGTIRDNTASKGMIYLANQGGGGVIATIEETAHIVDNKGLAVRVNNSSNLTMNGGEIARNSSYGIQISGKTDWTGVRFIMNGGKICDNGSYGIYHTVAGKSLVEINGGTISGNKGSSGRQISSSGGYAVAETEEGAGYEYTHVSADVMGEPRTIYVSAGKVELPEGYADVNLGRATNEAVNTLKAGVADEHADWTPVGSSALWVQPSATEYSFELDPTSSPKKTDLYVAYVQVNPDGSPIDGAEVAVEEVENAEKVPIALKDLTAGAPYAVMLFNNKEYTLAPDDITIYTGGGQGEENYDDGGFPKLTINGSVDVKYTGDITSLEIKGVTIPATDDKTMLDQLLENIEAVYTYEDGTVATDDSRPGVYTVALKWKNGLTNEDVRVNGNNVNLDGAGTLIVRHTQDIEEAQDGANTYVLLTAEPTKAVIHAEAIAKTQTSSWGTVYQPSFYTNDNEDFEIEDIAGIQLLDDSLLIDDDGTDRQALLEQKAEDSDLLNELSDGKTYRYDFHYLDLVDAYNGNAWVSASYGTTIYLPYPDGVTMDNANDLDVQVIHFPGLHREYGIAGQAEVTDAIEACEPEVITAEFDANGIEFDVDRSGFSPFAVVWQENAQTFTITASAGDGGSISPRGSVAVAEGADKIFTITPNGGYTIANVKVDEKSVGAVDSYTFTDVNANHTISATFARDSSGDGGGHDSDPYLRFDSNGGTRFDPIDEDGRSFSLNVYDDEEYGAHIPTRPGYRFTGWYKDSRLTIRVDEDETLRVTSSVTLFAGWTETSVPGMLNGDDHYAYIQGYSDGSVRPNANITRAQVATIFFRLLDENVRDDNLTTSNAFPDVNEDYWANTAISTMARLGVINGRNSGLFDPDANITRAEFAAICARFDDSGVAGVTTFTDTADHWAEDEISRAAALGWIQGYSDDSFRPDQYISRAQAVTMINRVLCRLPEDTDDLLSGMNTWTDCHESDWFYLAIQEATNSHDFVTKDRVYESWTDLNRAPDWSRYE